MNTKPCQIGKITFCARNFPQASYNDRVLAAGGFGDNALLREEQNANFSFPDFRDIPRNAPNSPGALGYGPN